MFINVITSILNSISYLGKVYLNMAEKKKSTFFKDFKAFISRGNILDMAVGVVIGGAFSKIVTGLVNYIINPFVGIFIKGGSLDSIKTVITPAVVDEAGAVTTPEVAILWGTWIQTIADFLIVALCIFTMLRVIVKARSVVEAEKIKAEEAKKAADEAAAAEAKKEADAQAAALAEKQAQLEASTLNQEKLLIEIRDLLSKK